MRGAQLLLTPHKDVVVDVSASALFSALQTGVSPSGTEASCPVHAPCAHTNGGRGVAPGRDSVEQADRGVDTALTFTPLSLGLIRRGLGAGRADSRE